MFKKFLLAAVLAFVPIDATPVSSPYDIKSRPLQAQWGPCTNNGQYINIDINGLFGFDAQSVPAQICFSKKAVSPDQFGNLLCPSGAQLGLFDVPLPTMNSISFRKGGFGQGGLSCTGNPEISIDMDGDNAGPFALGKCNKITTGAALAACDDFVNFPGQVQIDCSQQNGNIDFWFKYTMGEGSINEGTCSTGQLACYNPPATKFAEQSFHTPFQVFDDGMVISGTYTYVKSKHWNTDGSWATGQPYVYVKVGDGQFQPIGKCAQFRKSDTVIML